ncbi:hypothetical protein KIPB_002540 [Kipferlia bialata]|uniref:Uncharacterized protein n=1 Tax=Kipferlia bialata TaxID=797122 RepID=A0A9K3CQT1_9EUKA|nr:hypothetical protein KIPB_002540 [Kipferlia bialata]|eukprot:g2540.t1
MTEWVQVDSFEGPANDVTSLAMGGGVMVIGCPTDTYQDTLDHGSVYVYRLDEATGIEHEVTLSMYLDRWPGHKYGSNVAVSANGKTIFFSGSDVSGHVIDVFQYQEDGIWTFEDQVRMSCPSDSCNLSSSDDGTLVAMGCPSSNSHKTGAGKVQVFLKSSGFYTLVDTIQGSTSIEDFGFGSSLGVTGDGNALVIGASYTSNHSRLYSYNRDWRPDDAVGHFICNGYTEGGEDTYLGTSLTVDSNRYGYQALVGSPGVWDADYANPVPGVVGLFDL